MDSIQIPARPKVALPDDFARLLRRMQKTDDPDLSPLLAKLKEAGWTYQEIADALGVTRQAIGQRVKHPDRKPRVAVVLPDKIERRLRELHATARTVNGAMPPEHPARRDSEELSRMMADLAKQGVPVLTLAKALGITHYAAAARLYRHGYREQMPQSQPQARYKNRKVGASAG